MTAFARQRPSVIEAVEKGHAVGHESDGMDAQLSAVLVKFQKDRRLPPTGELDAATRKALEIR